MFRAFFVIGISTFCSLTDLPARANDQPSAVLLAERQNSDIRVVMYMTPW
jgi:hypothetical protein